MRAYAGPLQGLDSGMQVRAWTTFVAGSLAWAIAAPQAGAKPLLRQDDPSLALALSADADGDGFVTREEIADAAAKAVDGAEGEFDKDWRSKLAVYGMSTEATVLDLKAIFAATKRILDAADADKDGNVTPAELRAYVETFPVELRADMVEVAYALDRDADGTVTRDERDKAEAAFAKELARIDTMPPLVKDAMLHPTRATSLATWRESTQRIAEGAVDLWREVAGKVGKASLGELRDGAAVAER